MEFPTAFEGQGKTDRAIAERRARLGQGLISLGDAVIVTDPLGQIILLNPAAEALTGWADADAKNQPIESVFRIINEVTRLPVRQPVQGVIELGGTHELARLTLLVARDGTEVAIDDSAAPIRGVAGVLDGVVLIFRDISSRRLVEKGLEDARLQGEVVISAVQVSVVVLGSDLRIRSANWAFYDTFSASPEQTVGRTMFEFGDPMKRAEGLRATLREILQGAAEIGETPVERDFEAHGGGVMHLKARGLLRGHGEEQVILLTIEDVTDRRQMQASLEASEMRFRRLFEAAQDGILILDSRTGVITDANPFLLDLLGYSGDDLVGKRLWEIGLLGDVEASKASFLELQEKGYVRYDDIPLATRDGRAVEVEVVSNVYRVGALEIIQCTIRDITARKRADDLLRRAKDEAEEAGRAKDRFLAILSHELRTPLTPVLATIVHLEGRPGLPDDLREDMASIRRNVELEARLIDDLLDLTRIAQGKLILHPEIVDCHATLRAALAVCQVQVDAKKLEVTLALHAENHRAWGDPTRLRQVFWNLIQNATKFTPARGRLRLSTSDLGDGRLAIEVEDNGAGIEAEALGRIFEAFEQADGDVARRYGGLGLGLAIAKQLVDLHGGILVASSPGRDRGSVFRVELETVNDSHEVESQADEAHAAVGGPIASCPSDTPLNLLLVEDNRDTRHAIARLLRSSGFAVRTASGVVSALAAMAVEEFDLLISDIGLTDGSGLDVMRHGRDRFGLRGIAFSGYASDMDERESKEAGFIHHLAKPASLGLLIDLIRLSVPPRPALDGHP
ncbi:PAS domain S-box protein [Isosphaeraceae bacterium EP7]